MVVMEIILNIGIVIACAIFMEFFAWFTHKYVMHGFLWILHKDHHVPHKHKLELNDIFVVLFATPAVLLLVFGINSGTWPMISAGIGVTLYGIGYTLFHDIMFHKRIKWLKIPAKSHYFKRIIAAHRVHHAHTRKEDTISFGFLWAPKKYDEYVGKNFKVE